MFEYEVVSSAIHKIKYNEKTRVLNIEFNSGGNYDYYNVPMDEVEKFTKAESVGKYFHQHIKKYSKH